MFQLKMQEEHLDYNFVFAVIVLQRNLILFLNTTEYV